MYVVVNTNGHQLFVGHLSDATKYVIGLHCPLDLAIRAGIKIIPYALYVPEVTEEENV